MKKINSLCFERIINKILNVSKRTFLKFGCILSSDYAFWNEVKVYYRGRTGKNIDYRHPRDINEKMFWLMRYWQHPLKTKCADKFLVREYLKSKGMENLLIPLIGVWESPDDINFDRLPQSFVLKCNHGSGYNIICTNKDELDIEKTKAIIKGWLDEDYSSKYYEIHYRNIPRKVICEQLLDIVAPLEIQFWCINGEPDSILACKKNFDGRYESGSYSLDWIHLGERINEDKSVSLEKPAKLNELIELIEYARVLSEDFPFVRVDFFLAGEKIYFAELTFTPNGGVLSSYTQSTLDRLGEKLELPAKYRG